MNLEAINYTGKGGGQGGGGKKGHYTCGRLFFVSFQI